VIQCDVPWFDRQAIPALKFVSQSHQKRFSPWVSADKLETAVIKPAPHSHAIFVLIKGYQWHQNQRQVLSFDMSASSWVGFGNTEAVCLESGSGSDFAKKQFPGLKRIEYGQVHVFTEFPESLAKNKGIYFAIIANVQGNML